MVSIALTGNVAAGKSVVAGVLEAGGLAVLRSDQLARLVVVPGSPALAEVEQVFGADVLDDTGGLDRGRMRDLVFSDSAARKRLEDVLHPYVRRLRQAWMSERRGEGASVVVTEIPLLYELDLEDEFDAVVLVHASEEAREQRLVTGRGLDRESARAMMAAQGDPEEKLVRATRVIRNDGTLSELREEARDLLLDIQTGRFP